MSSNTIYTMDEANMFCGAQPTDQSASLHLKLVEVKIPAVDEQYVDHRGCGSPVAIEIDTIIARFECTFQIIGLDPQVFDLIKPVTDAETWFYIYGLIKDRQSGDQMQAAAQVRGRLARVDPQVYRRNDTLQTACSIRGITYFRFALADNPMWEWDFYSNFFTVGGFPVTEVPNSLLHIPIKTPVGPSISAVPVPVVA